MNDAIEAVYHARVLVSVAVEELAAWPPRDDPTSLYARAYRDAEALAALLEAAAER